MELTRVSKDICYYGNKGCGKTLAMTIEAYKKKIEGWIIYSNYHLKFGYIPLDSLKKHKDGL